MDERGTEGDSLNGPAYASGWARRRQHADWAREGTRPLIRRPLITKD